QAHRPDARIGSTSSASAPHGSSDTGSCTRTHPSVSTRDGTHTCLTGSRRATSFTMLLTLSVRNPSSATTTSGSLGAARSHTGMELSLASGPQHDRTLYRGRHVALLGVAAE